MGKAIAPEANVIFGAQIDHEKKDDLEITVLATGFESKNTVASGGVIQTHKPRVNLADDTDVSGTSESKEATGVGEDDYDLQKTSFTRGFPEDNGDFKGKTIDDDKEEDLESTPSFLRRKKDY